MKKKKTAICACLCTTLLAITFNACETKEEMLGDRQGNPMADSVYMSDFYVGGDLSYTAELEKAGVKYTLGGRETDLFGIFSTYGANMVKLRLWNSPTREEYSNLITFVESAKRVKDAGMSLLLDLYYSDSWTVTEKNTAPAAWTSIVNVPGELADSVYQYTYNTLSVLRDSDVVPVAVQIGNEANDNVLVLNGNDKHSLDIERNVLLLNAGIRAVRDFNDKYDLDVKAVLNMSLENADVLKLMEEYARGGLCQFDVLGVSYYPQQYVYSLDKLRRVATDVYKKYGVRLLIADTGCIWTKLWKDNSSNKLNSMPIGAPDVACSQLQKDFFMELKRVVRENFGYGVLAWEPEWVSSDKQTRWGKGSSWENAAFFDFNNEVLLHGGMDFMNEDNGRVTFTVDMSGAGEGRKGYIAGSFTDNGAGEWQILPMEQVDNTDVYSFTTYLSYSQCTEYYYLSDTTWVSKEGFVRKYVHPYGVKDARCADVWNRE